jgi:hypothetical protein
MRQDLKDKYFERLGASKRSNASRANKVNRVIRSNGANGANWKDNPYPACLGIVVAHLFFGLMSYLLWRSR